MKIDKILVPIDFSPCSYNALRYAAKIASIMNARIVLINVFSIPTPFADVGYYLDRTVMEEMEVEILRSMENLIADIEELQAIETEVAKDISITETIVEKANQYGIDLIIMGTHGKKGLNELFFSSHAASVLKDTKIPVLIIPETYLNHKINKIAFAGDYKALKEPSQIKLLKQLARKFGAEIKIFNVHPQPESIDVEEAFEAAQLENYLKQTKHDYYEVTHSDIEIGIHEFLEKHNIDLLVMIPRKHTLIERLFRKSLTQKMTHHLDTPLLALYDEY